MLDDYFLCFGAGKNGDGDNKSETSSGPSSNSTSGSNSNSRKGSATSSPRESPQPLSSQRSPFEGSAMPGSPSASCYFIMKASNNKILVTSEEKGLWATATSNEKKISKAFKASKFGDELLFWAMPGWPVGHVGR